MLVLEINYISFNKNNVFEKRKIFMILHGKSFLEIHNELSNKDKIEYIASLFLY